MHYVLYRYKKYAFLKKLIRKHFFNNAIDSKLYVESVFSRVAIYLHWIHFFRTIRLESKSSSTFRGNSKKIRHELCTRTRSAGFVFEFSVLFKCNLGIIHRTAGRRCSSGFRSRNGEQITHLLLDKSSVIQSWNLVQTMCFDFFPLKESLVLDFVGFSDVWWIMVSGGFTSLGTRGVKSVHI